MPAEIIAVANHKGGVGKSFTAVSLASGMAHAGWRTLLVDCDAQANATSMFDPDDAVEFDLLLLIGSDCRHSTVHSRELCMLVTRRAAPSRGLPRRRRPVAQPRPPARTPLSWSSINFCGRFSLEVTLASTLPGTASCLEG